jgi:hypothetical protein
MTHSEVINLINSIEEKFPVEQWTADEIHIWPLIRIQLAYKLYSDSSDKESYVHLPSKKSSFTTLKKIYRKAKHYLTKAYAFYHDREIQHRLSTHKDFLFISLTNYRGLLNNEWFNRQVDPLISICQDNNVSLIHLEYKAGVPYRTPRTHQVFCLQGDHFSSTRIYKLKKTSLENIHYSLSRFDEFFQYLKQNVPNYDSLNFTRQTIIGFVYEFFLYREHFMHLLQKVSPLKCFVTCYYHLRFMALCAAGKALNIPTFDIQHGVQGDFHVAYGRWNKVPENGYEMLPTVFLTWSDWEKEAINKWSSQLSYIHRAVVIGNPWLNMWKNDQNPLVKYYISKIQGVLVNPIYTVHVLYTMQPIDDALPENLLRAINQSPANWKWWLRMHPRQRHQKKEIKQTLQAVNQPDKLNFDEASDLPLPLLLKFSSVHVTLWSSAVLEAEYFGLPSVVMHENGRHLFRKQIERGMVYFSDSQPESLLDIIHYCLRLSFMQELMDESKGNLFKEKIIDDTYVSEMI